MGLSENSVPHCTQWFCWSLPLLNGYNWGYTPVSDIPKCIQTSVHQNNQCFQPGLDMSLATYAQYHGAVNIFNAGARMKPTASTHLKELRHSGTSSLKHSLVEPLTIGISTIGIFQHHPSDLPGFQLEVECMMDLPSGNLTVCYWTVRFTH